jgi:hypothetical protein
VWGCFLAELIYHQSGRQRERTKKGRLKYMNTRKKTNLKEEGALDKGESMR